MNHQSKKIRNHPLAAAEFEAEIDYFFAQGLLQQADDFKGEIDAALDRISANPRQWRLADEKGYPDIRTYGPTRKFKYRIGYIEEEYIIYILAYYYSGAEDPLNWLNRV